MDKKEPTGTFCDCPEHIWHEHCQLLKCEEECAREEADGNDR